MKHTPNLMTAVIHTKRRAYRCIVDKYSGNRYKVVIGPSFLADREFQYGHGLTDRKKLNLDEIGQQFDINYRYLYENYADSEIAEIQRNATFTFDECMKDSAFLELASQYSRHRNDLMTSDRECAAFVLALRDLFVPEVIRTA